MGKTLVRCVRDGCSNYRDENAPLWLCDSCREHMTDIARMIHMSTKKATHKAKADMMRYDYKVCSVKSCKKRAFMRNRCKGHYIEFMGKSPK